MVCLLWLALCALRASVPASEAQPADPPPAGDSPALVGAKPLPTDRPVTSADLEPIDPNSPKPFEDMEQDDAPKLILDLQQAILLASQQNLDQIREMEDIFLAEVNLQTVRRSYLPIPTAEVSAGMNEEDDQAGGAQPSVSGQTGVSQRLPLGGTASVNVGTSYDRSTRVRDITDESELRRFIEETGSEQSTTTDSYRPEATASLRQPLLRGAGRLVERESLTQAERELIYALRAYALFQQDLTIQTATTYWQLLQQRRSIETAERNLSNNQYSFEQSQAFLDIGKTTLDEVLRARIELVRAQQGVVDAERSFEAGLDQFKLDLFMQIETPIALTDQPLEFAPIEVDLARAIEDGLLLRLELMTSEDRIEDAERGLKIAKNGMMAQLDLVGNGRWRGDAAETFGDQDMDRFSYDASIQLTFPLERSQERQTLEQALIALSRAKRNHRNQRDTIILSIRRTVRDLRQAEASIQLQGINQREAARRLEKARLDYEDGEASNLSIIEAQNALVEAENSYYRAVVDYQIAKLQLLRETGRLELDENGMWIE